jgi:hypothetical protein
VILPLALVAQLSLANVPAPPAVTDLLAQRDRAWDADLPRIMRGETGGQGDVPNWRYDPRHTASGYIQITDTNWRVFAPKLGIDTQRYPTAMSAPGSWQLAVGKLMHRMFGLAPWDAAHGGSQPVVSTRTRGFKSRYVQSVAARLSAPRFRTGVPPAPPAPVDSAPAPQVTAAKSALMWRPFGREPCACRPSWQPFRQDGELQ